MGATARSRSIVINRRVVVHLWREATATVGPVLGTGTALYHHHQLVDERLNESSTPSHQLDVVCCFLFCIFPFYIFT